MPEAEAWEQQIPEEPKEQAGLQSGMSYRNYHGIVSGHIWDGYGVLCRDYISGP